MPSVIIDMLNRWTQIVMQKKISSFFFFALQFYSFFKSQLCDVEKHLLVSNVNMLAMFVLRLTSNRHQLLNSREHHIFSYVFCCPQRGGHGPATTD